jgi:predicted alpha/beta superfamily hydrolase
VTEPTAIRRSLLRAFLAAIRAAAFVLAVTALAAAPGDDPARAEVEFRVRVPGDTPEGEAVYLSGNVAELGSWRPDALRLERRPDGVHAVKVALPRGARFAFKVTRGSWRTVERAADGRDIPNREAAAGDGAVIEVAVARWAAGEAAPRRSTITGDVRRRRFPSRFLGNEREVLVWLPPGYAEGGTRHPVLYLHDGQNVFDEATAFAGREWGADEAADQLIRAGRIRPLIIVAIANTPDRMAEYTTERDARRQAGGKGELYARFLLEELKPAIDREYATLPGKEDTAVGGSSLGGLISLHLALAHPDKVARCAALSPALGWAEGGILRHVEARAARLRGARLWIDMGTREGAALAPEDREPASELVSRPIRDARRLADLLDTAGLAIGRDYYYFEAAGAAHDEDAWAARLPRVLVYLFGVENEGPRSF